MVGIDNQFNIISYAVISAKFESSSNLLDSILPLVEHALLCVDTKYIEEMKINEAYEEIYGYPIHSAILTQVLKILEKQGKIDRLKQEYIEIHKCKLSSYDFRDQYERKLRSLVSEINIFFKREGTNLSSAEIQTLIIEFLRKNAIDFSFFIDYKYDFDDFEDDNKSMYSRLAEFFIQERRTNSKHYEFIKEVYFGVVLSSIIISGDDITNSSNNKIKIKNVLLDSNYIFRLLDLQTSLEHQAALDTYSALRECGCEFFVCRETLKQISDTIRVIINNYSDSTNTILRTYGEDKFTGIASACVRRGLSSYKLELIVDELEDTLINEYEFKFIEDSKYNLSVIDANSEDFYQLSKIKDQASEFGVLHDLLLVHIVKDSRPRSIYKAEQANWWVLTDDNKLTRWNSDNKEAGGIPECITESQLATIMWVCNPKSASIDGFFNTVIALRSQGLAGNSEYIKISKIIEEQKERFANEPHKLRKLSMAFSQRLISIEDLVNEEVDEIDALFDQMICDSDKKTAEKDKLLQEKDDCITEQTTRVNELTEEVDIAKSLLSKRTEELISEWKARREEKIALLEAKNLEIENIELREKRVIKGVSVFLLLLIIIVLVVIFKLTLPLIGKFEQWYNSNQLLCDIISLLIPTVLGLLGVTTKKIRLFLELLSKVIVSRLSKNISQQRIEALKEDNNALSREIDDIQEKIELELEL